MKVVELQHSSDQRVSQAFSIILQSRLDYQNFFQMQTHITLNYQINQQAPLFCLSILILVFLVNFSLYFSTRNPMLYAKEQLIYPFSLINKHLNPHSHQLQYLSHFIIINIGYGPSQLHYQTNLNNKKQCFIWYLGQFHRNHFY